MPSRAGLVLVLLSLALVTPSAVAEFGAESEDGWPVSVHGDELKPPVPPVEVTSFFAPLNKVGPVTTFPYYPVLTGEVQRMATEHPDLVRLTSAGTSRLGLDMWLLEIADFDRIEAGDGVPLDEREVIYLDGGTHSNEYSGVYFVTEIAQFLLDEYETNETAQWIVENRHTWILPMVNPDGSNVFGRINAIGVNINRNFPAIWNEVDENPIMNNPGPEPASEPETQNVLAVLDAIQPDYVNSIHCCGNLWLHPYGHEDFAAEEDDLEMFTRICDEVFYDVRDDCGPIWSTIYPASGTTADTGYDLYGASSWTYEMSGRGAVAPWGQPVITDDPRVQEVESWRGVLHAMLHTERYGAHPIFTSIEGDDEALQFTITNDGYQPLRAGELVVQGTAIELPELAAGETTTLTVDGEFAAGTTTPVTLSYQKRVKHAPWGATHVDVPLVEDGGRLVGVLSATSGGDALTSTSTSDEDGENIPLPLALAVFAVAGAALVASRSRGRGRP